MNMEAATPLKGAILNISESWSFTLRVEVRFKAVRDEVLGMKSRVKYLMRGKNDMI